MPVAAAVILRAPSLPWPRDGTAYRAGDGALRAPIVREAMAVAAPGLLARWLELGGQGGGGLSAAMARYLVRMSSRPTPFGLFATVTLGSVGEGTRLELGAMEGATRVSRLDMEVLAAAAGALALDEKIMGGLRFFPNSSLYAMGGSLRYFQAHVEGSGRRYTLEEVETSSYLESTLEQARSGATAEELAGALVAGDSGIEPAEAWGFVRELIEEQILVPAFEPAITGESALGSMLEALGDAAERHPLALALESCRQELEKMDREGVGIDPDRYDGMRQRLKDAGLDVTREHLVQVDLFRPANVIIGEGVVREVLRAVDVLHRITPSAEPEELRRFRERFAERYGERMIPLVEALDEESGIGFGGLPAEEELIKGVPFGEKTRTTTSIDPMRHATLLALMERAWEEQVTEVELGADDLEKLAAPDPPPLPDTFSVMASIAAEHAEAIDAGRFEVLIKSVGGPSGANLLGRFCHLDGNLHHAVREHLAAEESLQPGAVFAEIVHLPEGRIGNVLFRPVLRGHEIPLLGRSGVPADRQIPVTDLMVTVRRGRIVLYSERLGKEVIPRLSTAHNYWAGRNLALYRFLCLAQQQGVAAGMGWRWDTLDAAAFLPVVANGGRGSSRRERTRSWSGSTARTRGSYNGRARRP